MRCNTAQLCISGGDMAPMSAHAEIERAALINQKRVAFLLLFVDTVSAKVTPSVQRAKNVLCPDLT